MAESTVLHWLEKGFSAKPEKAALVFGGESLSYAELDEYSNRIAQVLIENGVVPGSRVGLCLDRSVELIAVLVGILKSGAAYVPLDSAYPADRLAMMAADAGLTCTVAHAENTEPLAGLKSPVLIWEDLKNRVDEMPPEKPALNIGPERAAYIIFTSGSTGRPKGIEMPHRALANLMEWQLERKTFRPEMNVLQYSSISFDVSFQEIATTFASSGTLFLISNDDRKDPRTLLDALMQQEIGRLFLPYVAMRSLIETAQATDRFPTTLKETITAGEQLRVDDTVRTFFRSISGASLDNQYGPSETHVITAQLLEGDPANWPDLPSIGTPLKNCAAFILDEGLNPVADGEEGELFLAGRNLSHGYIGRPELTKDAFLETEAFGLIYKTGDLAAFNSDGSIDFRGRRDHQIKVLGHRVEPGEINNAAAKFPGLGNCLTHAFKSEDGVTRLATYYTVQNNATVSYADLRAHLDAGLPDYMVPAFLIELSEIPYTPSGKVDLKSLPEPSIENSRYASETVSYESETEAQLATIFSEVLGLEGIPRAADFFELGGDSLRAVTLFLKIDQTFGRDLPLSTLLQASTVEALADLLDGDGVSELEGCRSLKMIQPGKPGAVPLFLVHGGAGNILCFSKLVKNLGAELPVYAFQWSGWDGGPGETAIEELASVYCDEFLKHFPDTPVRLGGYCIGGYIAMELHACLKKRGVQVLEPLLVFDSPNLRSKSFHREEIPNPAGLEKISAQLKKLKRDDSIVYTPYKHDRLPWLKRTWPYALLRNFRTKKRLQMLENRARAGNPVPVDERSGYAGLTLKAALKKYRCPGTDAPVLYFRSESQADDMLLLGWWDSLYMGFDEVCRGGFEAEVIGGGHGEILDHVVVAEKIREAFLARGGNA